MYSTYILHSQQNGAYYIGSCADISKRLDQHNKGLVHSTKKGIPWVLVHVEYFTTRSEAYKREQRIKSWKKRTAIEKLFIHS